MSIEKVKYKSTKLDGRYAGYRFFSHYVTAVFPRGMVQTHMSITEFNKIRDWCLTTWGPSCELYDYEYLKQVKSIHPVQDYNVNEYWSYYVKDSVRRIYLTSKAKIWFDLTWM